MKSFVYGPPIYPPSTIYPVYQFLTKIKTIVSVANIDGKMEMSEEEIIADLIEVDELSRQSTCFLVVEF